MPLFIQEQKGLLVRVFNYQSRRDTRDGALALAHSLWICPAQRPILEALLLASDSTVLDLAQRFQVPPKTILLYQCLFYNVRGRLGNPGFVAQLVGWPGQTDSSERRLKLAACHLGVAGVLRALNLQRDGSSESPQQVFQFVTQQAGQDALAGVVQGLYGSEDNPALDLLKELRKSSQETAPQQASDALTSVSVNKSVNIDERFKRHIKSDLDRRTALATREVTHATAGATPNLPPEISHPSALDRIPEWKNRATQGNKPATGSS
jgi:hypothetical protein